MNTLTSQTFLGAITEAATYGEDAMGQCLQHTLRVSPGWADDTTLLTLAPVDLHGGDTYSIRVPYVVDAQRALAIFSNAVDRLITACDSADLFKALASDGFGHTF